MEIPKLDLQLTRACVLSARPFGFSPPPLITILIRFSFASSRVCWSPSHAEGMYPVCLPSLKASTSLARLNSFESMLASLSPKAHRWYFQTSEIIPGDYIDLAIFCLVIHVDPGID